MSKIAMFIINALAYILSVVFILVVCGFAVALFYAGILSACR